MIHLPWSFRFIIRDIKKHKLRNFITFFAIALSVGVLTAVNGAVDSLGYSQIGFITQEQSEVDLAVFPTDKIISNATKLAQNISSINEIADTSLRYIIEARIVLKGADSTFSIPMTLIALNFTQENILRIGTLDPSIDELGINETVLVGDIGHRIVEVVGTLGTGNKLQVTLPFGITTNFTIHNEVVENYNRFPRNNLVMLTNLETIWQFTGKYYATSIVAMFTNHYQFYSAISPEKSIEAAKKIAIEVQKNVGFDYAISIPIATALDEADFTGTRIFLNFIGIAAMILTGVLIFSLSTISVQEKTKEFAILRSIGYKDSRVFQIPLVQSLIISIIGSIIGLALGNILSSVFLSLITQGVIEISIYIAPTTYMFSLIVGIVLGVASSLLPAKNASRKNLIISLLESHSPGEETHISHERGPSAFLILLGLVLSFAGALIFLAFPILNLIEDESISTIFFLILLLSFLLGLVAIAIGGIAPVCERVLINIFTLPFKRVSLMVRMMVRRNRRRNNLTSVIFAVSLALILFLTTNQSIQTHTQISLVEHVFGADLVVQPFEESSYINQSIINYLNNHSNVKSLSFSTPGNIVGITGTQIRVGDAAFIESYIPAVFGISEDFPKSLFPGARYRNDDAFQSTKENNTVIISESYARALNLKVGSSLRARVEAASFLSGTLKSLTELNYGKDLNLSVVGVVSRLPGFFSVHEQEHYVSSSAIFIGNETWNTIVRKNNPENETPLLMMNHFNRIFIDIDADDVDSLQNLQTEIFLEFGSTVYTVRASQWVELLQQQLNQTNTIITVMLAFTTIIAFFAVFASTQTSVLESQKEIGVIKAIGLSDNAISMIFALENLIITIVSTVLGAISGYFLAYLQNFQTYIFLEMRLPILFPNSLIYVVFGICFLLALIGAYLPTRILSRANPSELLR